MFKPTHIILHHSATQDGKTLFWDDIRRYHREVNGWRDIGYHFGIELVESGYEILAGRMLDQPGAHTVNMNQKSIGVCFVGNFDLEPPPAAALELGASLVRALCAVFGIPFENVRGHRDYAAKSCPGKLFDLAAFRKSIGEA